MFGFFINIFKNYYVILINIIILTTFLHDSNPWVWSQSRASACVTWHGHYQSTMPPCYPSWGKQGQKVDMSNREIDVYCHY